jgi:protein phosphatase
MTLALRIGQCSLCGPYRPSNQDAVAVGRFGDLTLCLVADGSGRGEAGEIASRRAVEVVARELKCRLPPDADREQARGVIRSAAVRAHEELSALNGSERGNGTATLVAAVWHKGRELYVAHVGDSRAYRIRGERYEQLTLDHDVARALVAAGTITPEQARHSRISNRLWRYLGGFVGDGPEIQTVTAEPGDWFLLCTDGLSNYVTEGQAVHCVRAAHGPQECAEILVRLALEQGSRDNVSCVVMEVPRDPGPAERTVPAAVDPAWLAWNDGCVRKLARAVGEGGRLEKLPVLADALEDAGCADAALLAHCKQPGGHVEGCWVLERLQGRGDV